MHPASAKREATHLFSNGRRHAIARLLPGFDAAFQGAGILETARRILVRHTGGTVLVRSASVEDDLAILGKAIRLGLELIQRHGAFEMVCIELRVVVVRA